MFKIKQSKFINKKIRKKETFNKNHYKLIKRKIKNQNKFYKKLSQKKLGIQK